MSECPKCRKDLRFTVTVYLDMDFKHYRKITKKSIVDKTTIIQGVNWDRVIIYCPNCGYISRD